MEAWVHVRLTFAEEHLVETVWWLLLLEELIQIAEVSRKIEQSRSTLTFAFPSLIASCSVEVAAPDDTECDSLIGQFTFHAQNDTSDETISEIQDEMISMLRQGMETGRYENDVIWKITFVESAAANVNLSLGTTSSVGSASQQPNNPALSITIGFIVTILVAAIVFELLIVHKKKKELEPEPKLILEDTHVDTPSIHSSHGNTEWDQQDESMTNGDKAEANEQRMSISISSEQGEEPVHDVTFVTTDENEMADAAEREKTKVDEIAACDDRTSSEKETEQKRLEKERLEAERLLEASRIEKEGLEKKLEQERIKSVEMLERERLEAERLLEASRLEKEGLEKELEQERIEAEERLKKERLEAERLLETERLKVVNMLNSLDWGSQ